MFKWRKKPEIIQKHIEPTKEIKSNLEFNKYFSNHFAKEVYKLMDCHKDVQYNHEPNKKIETSEFWIDDKIKFFRYKENFRASGSTNDHIRVFVVNPENQDALLICILEYSYPRAYPFPTVCAWYNRNDLWENYIAKQTRLLFEEVMIEESLRHVEEKKKNEERLKKFESLFREEV